MFGKKKHKEAKQPGGNWTDKAAGKIAGAGIKLQTKFAHVMNKRVSKIPQQKLKTVLVAFCLLSGGFSIYLAANAIFGTENKQPSFEVKKMDVPKHFNKTGSEINEPENSISHEMYREIQEYKKYMDSLKQPIRPGLLDSIRILENIYHSQQIK
ncbi:MAG: hypothetical protein J0I32_11040 [Sphingobacteriales bacterium]|nr:hypothetical protein [Sphingobacteriales bacterium]OJW01184.1 MAG: hypothetical protein BGO52_07060 [Sphingobacteriales bacterium 44-61]